MLNMLNLLFFVFCPNTTIVLPPSPFHYLCQGGYVFTPVNLFVGLFVIKITKKLWRDVEWVRKESITFRFWSGSGFSGFLSLKESLISQRIIHWLTDVSECVQLGAVQNMVVLYILRLLKLVGLLHGSDSVPKYTVPLQIARMFPVCLILLHNRQAQWGVLLRVRDYHTKHVLLSF